MKYKAGDKFIIEIWDMAEAQGLYTIKGFNTLVFDDYGLDRLDQVYEQSGYDDCKGCEHEEQPTNISPCDECSRNMLDFWTPKPEEIQVGDEVEYDGEFGIVVHRSGSYLAVLDRDLDRRTWGVHSCTRTGETYPDLIKALEQLPKEGE